VLLFHPRVATSPPAYGASSRLATTPSRPCGVAPVSTTLVCHANRGRSRQLTIALLA
jgi:hypothetical protein